MKIKYIILAVMSMFVFSCFGINGGYVGNLNQTQVVLQEGNYNYVGTATGEATAVWIFSFGPMNNNALVKEAKEDLTSQVDLYNGSRALVNLTVDQSMNSILGIYNTKTVYVTADVIEFE